MKKYTVLAVILILFILLFIASMGIYFIKRDEIKANIFSDNTENTTVAEQGKESTDSEVKVIKTVGTGPKRPENYSVEEKYIAYGEGLIDNLKNEDLKNEIKAFISDSQTKMESEKDEFLRYIEEGNKVKGKVLNGRDEECNYYEPVTMIQGKIVHEPNINTSISCVNGYLSVAICLSYSYGEYYIVGDPYWASNNTGIYDVCCATYDLYTGKKLQFSDLFFEGEDYSTEIYEIVSGNNKLSKFIKRDFTTLPQDYEYFTINMIYFPKKNLFFSEGTSIGIDYSTSVPAITIPRNMEDIFIDNSKIKIDTSPWQFRSTLVQKEILGEPFKVPIVHYPDEKIGEKINNNIVKTLEYFISNKLFESSLTDFEREHRSSRNNLVSGLGTYRAGYGEEEYDKTLCCSVFYCDVWGILSIHIDPKTGEVVNFGPSSHFSFYESIKDDIPNILEEINNN